jgi:hypothetical protein
VNFLTKTVVGIGLLAVSTAAMSIPIEFTGEYEYRGSASSNFLSPGDPHNIGLIDAILDQDVDVIVVDGITEDEEVLIQFLSTNFSSTGEYSFDWSVTSTSPTPWNVVGLAVKAGNINHYFKLDPHVPVSAYGSFDLFSELTEENFMPMEIKGVSHIDMFGVKNGTTIASAPTTGILTALGVMGIIAFRRKKSHTR